MQRLPASFFRPQTVAIVGASTSGLGYSSFKNLVDHGFNGPIYLVNPRRRTIDGWTCYPDLASLPETPDLAYILVPRQHMREVFNSACDKGIRHLVVTTGGFSEADSIGRAMEQELREVAASYGATILGPNCEGFWNIPEHTIVSFGSAARTPIPKCRASVAIVSQSGSLGAALARRLQESGFGCDYYMSTGNELNVDVLDVLEWLLDYTTVQTIGLFIEAFSGGNRLVSLAHRAHAADRSIVVLAAGRSEAGQRATQSHTGRIASAGRVYDGVLTQAGVVPVSTFREFELALRILAHQKRSVQKGPVVLAISGGSRALIADALQDRHVPLPSLSPATQASMAQLLPEFAQPINPIDLTGQVLVDPEIVPRAVEVAMEDDNSDAVLLQFANRGVEDVHAHEHRFIEAGKHRPLILSLIASRLDPKEENRLTAAGLIVVNDPVDGVFALQVLMKPSLFRWMRPEVSSTPKVRKERLSLDDAIALLQAYDIHFPMTILASEVIAGRTTVNFPVVAKLAPIHVAHKSDVGGVVTNITNIEEIKRAVARLESLKKGPVVIQEQVRGVEALVAVRDDPDFGLVMALGVGGIFTELLKEVVFRALPLDHVQIDQMIEGTKLEMLLKGVRGQAAANREGLIDLILNLQELYLAQQWLEEIELNPVVVPYEAGRPAVPVDIVMQVRR